MDNAEFARRAYALAEKYADRLPRDAAADVRDFAAGGVWDQLLALLVAALSSTKEHVTTAERDELAALLTALGHGTEQLDELNVSG